MRSRRSQFAGLTLGLLLVVGAGCASKSYDKYIPSDDKARQALEAALSAWRDGKKPGLVEGAPVPVQVVDTKWQGGQKLKDFEILQDEPGDGPRVFSVRLTLQKPAGQKVVVR